MVGVYLSTTEKYHYSTISYNKVGEGSRLVGLYSNTSQHGALFCQECVSGLAMQLVHVVPELKGLPLWKAYRVATVIGIMFARPNLGQNRVTWSGDVVVRPHQMLPLYQLTVIAGPGMLDLCMHWQSERVAPEYLTSTLYHNYCSKFVSVCLATVGVFSGCVSFLPYSQKYWWEEYLMI